MNRLKTSFLTTLAVGLLALAAPVRAAWPDKPVELIVTFAPGGGTDTTARTLRPYLEKYLGATIVVVNKPGASGETGLTAIAEAKPDGYTLGMVNYPGIFTLPIERKTRFSLDSFELIANLVADPSAFTVRQDSPFHIVKDVIDYATANPSVLTVGSSGVSTDDHFAMLLFQRATGVKLTHVPFAGSNPIRTAVLGGHIAIAGINAGEMMPYRDRLRILGQMNEQRSPLIPEVPTFREQGVDVLMSTERGIVGPKGLPKDILDRVAEAVDKAVHDPEFVDKTTKAQFTEIKYRPAKEWEAYLRDQDRQFRNLWQAEPWVPHGG